MSTWKDAMTLAELRARYPGRTIETRRIGGLSFADDI